MGSGIWNDVIPLWFCPSICLQLGDILIWTGASNPPPSPIDCHDSSSSKNNFKDLFKSVPTPIRLTGATWQRFLGPMPLRRALLPRSGGKRI
ncbi:hypothetical protein EYF80_025779 [Liparis tanakae]|uniref:Uncharacterized protein n=1 Tax=Liparis tanakae TaxID=230148 RepID=A0A4Z2HEB0_9TELE|nr:hypothetical protein EYF80_025779 [Liparis tanakae]